MTDNPRFKGVSYRKTHRRWVASYWTNGKKIHLGMFGSAEEAARHRDQYLIKVLGDRAELTFKCSLEVPRGTTEDTRGRQEGPGIPSPIGQHEGSHPDR